MNLQKLAEKFKTPTYVYDIPALLKRVAYLKEMLGYDLVYAVKANTFIAKELENVVCRYEICSPGEFTICNNLNINPQKMVISGVYKDEETITNILKTKDVLKYTIESVNQYNLLNDLTLKYQKEIHILIRLTSGNQFGVTEEELKDIIKNNQNKLIIIDGIEYFSGTQKHSISRLEKEIDHLKELINDIETNLNFEIKEVEYGPGLPVFYYQNEEFNEDEFLTSLKEILKRIDKKISLEIGRSIAASCGTYLTKVVDMKTNKYGNFVILDGGINHLVYYGQTMAMKIPHYKIISQNKSKEEITYNLCGSLCTINDFLVKNISLPKLSLGDIICFLNVGAYSSTEGISLFLSRDLPKVVLYKNNEFILVRDTIKTSDINYPNY